MNTQPEQREQARSDDVPVLRRAAMDALARREHSRHELRQTLRRKFPDTPPALIETVLARLQEENLQSDERFIESYVCYRKSRGFGCLHIQAELAARQVAPELIEAHLVADDDEWLAIARDLVARRLGEGTGLAFGSKPHRTLLRFLESRGFTSAQIRKAVEPILNSSSGVTGWD